MRWTELVARVWKMRNAYNITFGEPPYKISHGKSVHL